MSRYLHGVDVIVGGGAEYEVVMPDFGTGDPELDAIIGDVIGARTTPQAGVTYLDHDTVLAVQKALLDSGYSVGKAGADGLWGKDTAAAVRAMQAAHEIPVTGVIDFGVLNALGVPAPSFAPTRTDAGTSASAAAQDVKRTADNAAVEAAKADSPPAVQAAAATVNAAANAIPPAPPDVQAEVKKAVEQAKAAKTPEEVKVAAKAVEKAAEAVSNAAVPSFWSAPAWQGAPVKRWQAAAGGIGLGAVAFGIIATLWRR